MSWNIVKKGERAYCVTFDRPINQAEQHLLLAIIAKQETVQHVEFDSATNELHVSVFPDTFHPGIIISSIHGWLETALGEVPDEIELGPESWVPPTKMAPQSASPGC